MRKGCCGAEGWDGNLSWRGPGRLLEEVTSALGATEEMQPHARHQGENILSKGPGGLALGKELACLKNRKEASIGKAHKSTAGYDEESGSMRSHRTLRTLVWTWI